jgi:hypothetical protein
MAQQIWPLGGDGRHCDMLQLGCVPLWSHTWLGCAQSLRYAHVLASSKFIVAPVTMAAALLHSCAPAPFAPLPASQVHLYNGGQPYNTRQQSWLQAYLTPGQIWNGNGGAG